MDHLIRMRLATKGRGDFSAEAGTIWLYDASASSDGEAEWAGGISPRQFISALAETTGPVTLRVNSPGGSVFGAQAMIAAMRAHPEPITVQIDSLAASAASVIAAEAAECVISPGAMMMIHQAWGMTVGNADDHAQTQSLLSRMDRQIAETYARRGAGSADEYLAMMAAETWFDAAEAVAAGLSDRIADAGSQRVSAQWDLSGYQAAPWAPAAIEPAAEPGAAASLQDDMRQSRMRRAAARIAMNPI